MAGKSPSEAVDNFLKPLSETLSCITADIPQGFQPSDKLRKVFFDPPAEVRKRNGTRGYVSVTQIFSVVSDPETKGHFKVRTRHYSYVFCDSPALDTHGIVSYHWHPHDFGLIFPHLHVSSVPRVHFPTSRVCLEDFVEMLIDYYDIVPIKSDSQWKRILKKNKSAFDKYATWKIQAPRA